MFAEGPGVLVRALRMPQSPKALLVLRKFSHSTK